MTIEELLKQEGKFLGPTKGVSMLPMLKEGRDTIVVYPKKGRLAPYDVALYKRGEDYILHRVISVTDWGYIIRGDNCYYDEKIKEDRVIGVLGEYFKGDKHVLLTDKEYIKYSKRIVKNYPIRKFKVKIKGFIKSVIKKVFFKKRQNKTK